jgi:hypothetical protein
LWLLHLNAWRMPFHVKGLETEVSALPNRPSPHPITCWHAPFELERKYKIQGESQWFDGGNLVLPGVGF